MRPLHINKISLSGFFNCSLIGDIFSLACPPTESAYVFRDRSRPRAGTEACPYKSIFPFYPLKMTQTTVIPAINAD